MNEGDYSSLCAKIDETRRNTHRLFKAMRLAVQRDSAVLEAKVERLEKAFYGDDGTGGIVDVVRSMRVLMRIMVAIGSVTVAVLTKMAWG
jgi:hypothetical protein